MQLVNCAQNVDFMKHMYVSTLIKLGHADLVSTLLTNMSLDVHIHFIILHSPYPQH